MFWYLRKPRVNVETTLLMNLDKFYFSLTESLKDEPSKQECVK